MGVPPESVATPSDPLPPRYVEKTSAEPPGFTTDTKAFSVPFKALWKAPVVVGKSFAEVFPVTYASPTGQAEPAPRGQTAIPSPMLVAVPPMKVTYCSPKTGLVAPTGTVKVNLATKASSQAVNLPGVGEQLLSVCRGSVPGGTAKSVDIVLPVTYALLAASIAMPSPSSKPLPPRSVE